MKTVSGDAVTKAARQALDAGEGILRLAPTWVPRSFLQPGKRLKLHPDDYYALGTHRGGIDERWFASTTHADNEGAPDDEGLSYVVHEDERFTLRHAIAVLGADIVGSDIWNKYKRWPVYSKFFDNMGPIPHHLHQNFEQAALIGRDGKPEAYYFPPQLNFTGNNFPYTFFGLEPGTTREQVCRCIERWNEGDNGILDLSKAYRLKPGTGWLVGPCILHAPGSLLTYEPQWGSDVFGMYQSIVEGRAVPRSLLVKDMPEEKQRRYRFHRRPDRLGRECRYAFQGPPLPGTHPRRRHGQRRLCGSLDHVREIQRETAFHREGIDRPARRQGHDQGQRRVRRHPQPGPWPDWEAGAGMPGHDPFRRNDRRRGVHLGKGGASRLYG